MMARPMGGYVLIVESAPDVQRTISDALKEARYELASEAESTWARRSISVRTPDAIIIDTMLSDGDGFRLAEDLRRDPDTRDTPIFFVASRFRGASHRAEARRRFAPAEYLPTPIDANSLLAWILQAVPPAEGSDGASAGGKTGDKPGDKTGGKTGRHAEETTEVTPPPAAAAAPAAPAAPDLAQ